MYGQLVSNIRNYVAKAKFMGLENAESTKLLETAVGAIEYQEAVIEAMIHQDEPVIIPAEEVYGQYTDTAGNFHWCGTHSGEHTIKAEECET